MRSKNPLFASFAKYYQKSYGVNSGYTNKLQKKAACFIVKKDQAGLTKPLNPWQPFRI